jgi:hypothetical protein
MPAATNDAHCHFFSTPFFAALGGEAALATLGWEAPGTADALADRWVAELDRHQVARATLIASIPGDTASVAAAVRRHPGRFVGFFMVDPTQPGAAARAAEAIVRDGMRGLCLFPAMHRYSIQDERALAMFGLAASTPGTVVFVHCGVLSVGCAGSSACRARSISGSATRSISTPSRSATPGADRHPALRRRPVSRGADDRRPLPERAVRHVELEQLDQAPPA